MTPETSLYLDSLHRLHTGWNCYIIGNSPSLNEITEAQKQSLYNGIIIGTNSSYKFITGQYHWFVNSDPENLTPDDVSFIESTTIPCFNINVPWEKNRFEHTHYLNCLGGQGWSNDLYKGVFAAFTVVHPAIQFAAWLGCNSITLIGCDFTPIDNKMHFEKKATEGDVPIHWEGMNQTITQCIEPLAKLGIKLYNASPHYAFNTIEKVTL